MYIIYINVDATSVLLLGIAVSLYSATILFGDATRAEITKDNLPSNFSLHPHGDTMSDYLLWEHTNLLFLPEYSIPFLMDFSLLIMRWMFTSFYCVCTQYIEIRVSIVSREKTGL